MRVVKGTYRLVTYTYTPQHEPKDGSSAKTYDYVNDKEYMFEDYLIVTGDDRGYYVHKEAGGDNYIKEVTLRYEYDTVDSRKINYVIYNDSATGKVDTGITKLGVMKNSFNYSKTPIDVTGPITQRPLRTESISISWKKVTSSDTSKVTAMFNELKYYDYDSFGRRGIYELTPKNTDGESARYDYIYYLIDTAESEWRATIYYSLAGSGEHVVKNVSLLRSESDWSVIEVGGAEWITDPSIGSYTVTLDGVEYICSHVSNRPLDAVAEALISSRIVVEGEPAE